MSAPAAVPEGDADAAKRALLERLLRERVGGPAAIPLSFGQERLWFWEALNPGGALYNMTAAVRLRGPLDPEALRRAIGQVLARHEVLRARFEPRDGSPVQVVVPGATPDFRIEDPDVRPGTGSGPAVAAWLAAEAERPFDLAAGPPIRVRLRRVAPDEHVLLVVLHHLVADDWSVGVFWNEVSEGYRALLAGRPALLPALPVQYRDYAAWQRERHRTGADGASLEHWRSRLAGAPELLALPTDRPRPPTQSHRGADHRFRLPPALAESLQELARNEGVTRFMVLLAAFQLLLSRWSGQPEVVVGSPVAGRGHPGVEGLIGFFANTVALRTDLGGDPAVRTLLERVRGVVLAALAHQDAPFEHVVDALSPRRTLRHAPVFQVLVAFRGEGLAAVPRLPRVEAERVPVPRSVARFDLTLQLEERDEGIDAVLNYATDLFDETTIRRMADQLARVLEAFGEDPGQRLSRIELPGEAGGARVPGVEGGTLPLPASDARHPSPSRAAPAEPGPAPGPFVAPRTGAEAVLAGIWAEELGVDRVGIHDNFFALGGHSLLAVRVAARASRRLGAELSVATIFEHGTLALISDAVTRAGGRRGPSMAEVSVVPGHGGAGFSPGAPRPVHRGTHAVRLLHGTAPGVLPRTSP